MSLLGTADPSPADPFQYTPHCRNTTSCVTDDDDEERRGEKQRTCKTPCKASTRKYRFAHGCLLLVHTLNIGLIQRWEYHNNQKQAASTMSLLALDPFYTHTRILHVHPQEMIFFPPLPSRAQHQSY